MPHALQRKISAKHLDPRVAASSFKSRGKPGKPGEREKERPHGKVHIGTRGVRAFGMLVHSYRFHSSAGLEASGFGNLGFAISAFGRVTESFWGRGLGRVQV